MKPIILLCALSLSACATAPEAVLPIAPASTFAPGPSCDALDTQVIALNARLDALSNQQRATRQTNAWAIALVGLPLASMNGGDVSRQIGEVKGEIAAVDVALEACR